MPRKPQYSRKLILYITAIITVINTVIFFFTVPVSYTLLTQRNDGMLTPSDPISGQTPLEQCFDGPVNNVSALSLLMGTYNRLNDNHNHFELFTFEDGQKSALYRTDFPSSAVKDNDYFRINFPDTSVAGKFCFRITSADATAGNSITYWLNGRSQPVLKLHSFIPLRQALENITGTNRIQLPFEAAVALCLLYLAANTAIIILVIISYGRIPPSPQSAHSR